MKKLSLLIALCMLISIGGVYATWTYTQATDVADETVNMAMNLTDVAYVGTYGTYKVDTSALTLKIDPKAGTTHTTSLVIEGQIVISFTPATYAPETVKQNAVASTFQFKLSNSNWQYEGENIVTLTHAEAEAVTWTKQADGTFTFTIDAAALAEHIQLGEFVLDTKTKYDAFNTALSQGQITISVSDGVSSN